MEEALNHRAPDNLNYCSNQDFLQEKQPDQENNQAPPWAVNTRRRENGVEGRPPDAKSSAGNSSGQDKSLRAEVSLEHGGGKRRHAQGLAEQEAPGNV